MSGSDSDDGTTPQSTKEEDVLVISLGVPTECPGMLPEHKVHTALGASLDTGRLGVNYIGIEIPIPE